MYLAILTMYPVPIRRSSVFCPSSTPLALPRLLSIVLPRLLSIGILCILYSHTSTDLHTPPIQVLDSSPLCLLTPLYCTPSLRPSYDFLPFLPPLPCCNRHTTVCTMSRSEGAGSPETSRCMKGECFLSISFQIFISHSSTAVLFICFLTQLLILLFPKILHQ